MRYPSPSPSTTGDRESKLLALWQSIPLHFGSFFSVVSGLLNNTKNDDDSRENRRSCKLAPDAKIPSIPDRSCILIDYYVFCCVTDGRISERRSGDTRWCNNGKKELKTSLLPGAVLAGVSSILYLGDCHAPTPPLYYMPIKLPLPLQETIPYFSYVLLPE